MKRRIVSIVLIMLLILPSFSAFAEEEVSIDKIQEIIDYVENYYQFDITREELVSGAYRGIMAELDKHSSYFPVREYNDFVQSLDGELIGIGVYVEPYENQIKVISPIIDMPAEQAGIESGDIITHIDDKDVTEYTFEQAINMILGEAGTEVKITVNREGQTINFLIIRQLIVISDVDYEMLDNHIGYLRIKQFGSSVSEEVDQAIADLEENNMEAIIIDLRNNPGGYLNEVIQVADWFIDAGDPIVHTRSKALGESDFLAKKEALNLETVVIINEGTASASEILSGAIQNNEEGIIIGQTSYGKGTVQNLITLTDGSAIKLTTAEYLAAGEVPVNGIGIIPDILVQSVSEEQVNATKYFVPMIDTELKYHGTTGLDVYGAQQRLNFLGYDVEITGTFDGKTFRALEAFQQAHKLERLHAIYPETKVALNTAVDALFTEDPQLDKAIELINE